MPNENLHWQKRVIIQTQYALIYLRLISYTLVYGFFWQKLNTHVFPYMLAYMQRVEEHIQTKKTSKTETAPSLMSSVLTHCSNPPRSQRQHLPSPTETNQINPQPNPYSKP
jgi:hypothetical protein